MDSSHVCTLLHGIREWGLSCWRCRLIIERLLNSMKILKTWSTLYCSSIPLRPITRWYWNLHRWLCSYTRLIPLLIEIEFLIAIWQCLLHRIALSKLSLWFPIVDWSHLMIHLLDSYYWWAIIFISHCLGSLRWPVMLLIRNTSSGWIYHKLRVVERYSFLEETMALILLGGSGTIR